jgi:hypothetical protein
MSIPLVAFSSLGYENPLKLTTTSCHPALGFTLVVVTAQNCSSSPVCHFQLSSSRLPRPMTIMRLAVGLSLR